MKVFADFSKIIHYYQKYYILVVFCNIFFNVFVTRFTTKIGKEKTRNRSIPGSSCGGCYVPEEIFWFF